jgi:hypothetical protein
MTAFLFAHLRRHCVGYVALLFSMGGTSYAATNLLPANSVGTKQVINHSLLKADFKAGQLPAGERGPAGPAGSAGIAAVTAVDGPAVTMCASGGGACQIQTATATCPSGSVVVGGGWASTSSNVVVAVARRGSGTTYVVIGVNYSTASHPLTAQAICASGPGVGAGASATNTQVFENALKHAKEAVQR